MSHYSHHQLFFLFYVQPFLNEKNATIYQAQNPMHSFRCIITFTVGFGTKMDHTPGLGLSRFGLCNVRGLRLTAGGTRSVDGHPVGPNLTPFFLQTKKKGQGIWMMLVEGWAILKGQHQNHHTKHGNAFGIPCNGLSFRTE